MSITKNILTLCRRRPVVPAILAVLATIALAAAFRYLVVEPQAVGLLCERGTPPAWCRLRAVGIWLFNIGLFGGAATVSGIAALIVRRHIRTLGTLAMVCGAAGTLLYNVEWGLPGLLLGLLALTPHRDAAQGLGGYRSLH